DLDARDDNGDTPLSLAYRDGYPYCVRALISAGANVNGEGAKSPPLHRASRRGHASTVRLLLKSGADPHFRDWKGETALHAAARGRDCTATVSALVEGGADPNAGDRPPLHYTKRPPPCYVELLGEDANTRIHGPQGRTALHVALMDSNCTTTILSALLDAGADPNARDDGGLMSLHYAVQYRCSHFVTQLLLQAGADPHSRDIWHRTPLFCTTFDTERNPGWLEHALALRDAGADVDVTDEKDITPLYHALFRQEVGTACSLLRLGADPYV
ncbi:hypothetical protein BOTBODRAFT_85648, partial [Botryobasidium botryosum FD-172 SS1]